MEMELKAVRVTRFEPSLKSLKEMADFILPDEALHSEDEEINGKYVIGKIKMMQRIKQYFKQTNITMPEGD